MNLDLINEMWSQDSIIDPDNLHEESIKTPRLHAKYHELYNTVLLLKKKEEHNHKTKYLEREIITMVRQIQKSMKTILPIQSKRERLSQLSFGC